MSCLAILDTVAAGTTAGRTPEASADLITNVKPTRARQQSRPHMWADVVVEVVVLVGHVVVAARLLKQLKHIVMAQRLNVAVSPKMLN